ncbi:MFS transporter [Selenomonas sputigena]|uniref:Major facilitator superfamily MFS_1 n=1 Tax=Selenomonas sputigena (strain ATCC 35185 / DSM 20758 / CCUG 44933 / VPI D19B-28) TaxID=546271 RepID=C9LWF2_SELS3|nr:MFS transporter [Selenomonas sputigena]AEB99687.1 major facilitator superfamily MFS_1 [Selenomonas sputigena ATCC 35185]EEX76802.1 transporter, major facilitator family protein [Selenomonas sputigena ATCC 35185]
MADEMAWKNLGPNPSRKEILACWNPEDAGFWEKYGKRIATQNLYTSTWALVLSFVAWTLWATIAAKLKFIGFNFSDDQIFTLAALPGLVGATGRLFYTYLPGLIGGRNSTFITTALLLLPLFGLGRALQDPTTSYETFVLLVSFIGIAGANFSASMANIGFFFPKANKGFALGINAGIGNLGVSLIYLTAPILLGWNLSSLFGEGVPGPDGMMYVQNVCYFWTIPTALTLVLIWLFMDNLPLPKQSPKSMMSIFGNKHTWLMCWIYTCGFGSFIGFSAALGLLVAKEFPEMPFSYAAFLGPFIGAGIRPVGGLLADKVDSGSRVTLISLFVMLGASFLVLFGVEAHRFPVFFGAFLLLFLTTGFINGASFRMIPYIFNNPFHSSLVTGFTAAIAAYGAFFIPKLFGFAYANYGVVAPAFYILIAFTVSTIVITWYFYDRKGSGIRC